MILKKKKKVRHYRGKTFLFFIFLRKTVLEQSTAYAAIDKRLASLSLSDSILPLRWHEECCWFFMRQRQPHRVCGSSGWRCPAHFWLPDRLGRIVCASLNNVTFETFTADVIGCLYDSALLSAWQWRQHIEGVKDALWLPFSSLVRSWWLVSV